MLEVVIEKDIIRIGERFAVTFQRTLRIPDDGLTYPLPPGLGRFPIFSVEDYRDSMPASWVEEGGAFIPMFQREALWLGFHGALWKPNAVKIGVGRVNAVSGGAWDFKLRADPQDYVVCPEQPWLDGIHSGHGTIRQFVAMPLGLGYTIEASMTGLETFGGVQILVFEPKPGRFPDAPPLKREGGAVPSAMPKLGGSPSMGLGAGGVMKQKIYPDPYGIDVWDEGNYGRISVHILNSAQFTEITGFNPPATPIDAQTYTRYGLPWFGLYDESRGDLPPSEMLARVKTISARDAERGVATQGDASFQVPEGQVRKLGKKNSRAKESPSPVVREHSPEDE
ncbi:hypothetical protein [Desulforhabdus sp. TSK]|uniref:hypothetical protein n=1 Tax=Desulforhabdus sp. TSK TaxID=2925014 RepID=UPI001FC8D020|nr:hypothetical protein [Desulforhabdus sp. TSK]GKT08824.1 hypothetical protein DSTSK_21290 [Desulforhabdus sp. TSK]